MHAAKRGRSLRETDAQGGERARDCERVQRKRDARERGERGEAGVLVYWRRILSL